MPVEERPVPRNMKISKDILNKFGYTPGFAKCEKLSRNGYSHPGLGHSQDCRTRIEARSRTDPVYRDRAERAEQRKIDFYANKVERIDHPRRASLELNVMPEPPTEEKEGEDQPSARDTKRARGEPEQDISSEIHIPSTDETLTPPEIPAVPSSSTPSSSTLIPVSPAASSNSGVKRTYSESTALPNSPGVDEEEQPGTRARSSTLIAGLHGVDVAEDDEISSGDGITDERLSSWYPETQMSEKMVLEAKRKDGKIQEDEGASCCHKGIRGNRRRRKNYQHQVGGCKQKVQKNTQLPRHVC